MVRLTKQRIKKIMNKFTWLEIIEVTLKMFCCIAFVPACYFILLVCIELQNSMVGAIV
tara:strand:- start:1947 stop:2120 length:174 start_codon:yes stop_codon:yes gene_type:complete